MIEMLDAVAKDRGLELAAHKKLAIATRRKVYFADPHAPWQRGSNENSNGLLRQYFPKRMDPSTVTPERSWQVAQQLNKRPRETLGWKTPAYKLLEVFRRQVEPLPHCRRSWIFSRTFLFCTQ